jgi:uncharacterized membrane protein (Fun14 family)
MRKNANTQLIHVILPHSWVGKRVFAVLKDEYDKMRQKEEKAQAQTIGIFARSLIVGGKKNAPLISFAGSGVAGFFIGMLLRRVLHILLIIVGSFLGALFLAIQYMANKGYLGNVQIDWTRIGNDTAVSLQNLVAQFSNQHIFGVLGIPATSGLAIGVIAGLAKR